MLNFSEQKLSPSSASLKILATLVAICVTLGIVLGLWKGEAAVHHLSQFSLGALLVFIVLGLFDALMASRQQHVRVERKGPSSIAVDRWTDMQLIVHHDFNFSGHVELYDDLADDAEFEGLPARVDYEPGKKSTLIYRLKVNIRGPFSLGECHVRAPSPFRMWSVQYRAGTSQHLKVYPDFATITAFTILATDNHESQIGIKRKPRRGEGLEFLQLRDYRSGDSLRQIDWKATSRRNKLISKEYQDERDQHIVLLIDSGRRMRAKDDNLSHFDHSLNATLLVSYIALRQGDSVSVMSFGDSHRWIAPQKGVGAMKTILNGMYDLQASNCAPDYVQAAEKLSVLQRKRSLVILVTNSRDEEVEELLMATKLIRRRHVLLLANIREEVLDRLQEQEVNGLEDALTYAGLHQFLRSRQEVQQKIASNGVYAIDCVAKQLATRVANSYLEIKRARVL